MSEKYLTNVFVIFWTLIIIAAVASAAPANASTSSGGGSQSSSGPTNMAVDFGLTGFSSQLSSGDSGVMNLVIKNAGGQDAENVEVYIPSTGSIAVNKRQYIGHMNSGDSKTTPFIIRIEPSASAGLNIIQARISFDGYDTYGKKVNGQMAVWEIPITVYSNPSFQIKPESTSYYKDTTGDLVLDGTVRDGVKDLEATFSSSCITVIGSSKAYVGDVGANQNFKITYMIKPAASGACTSNLALTYTDESGGKSSATSSFGINIQDAGVDFKLTDISYNPTGPGSTVNVTLTLDNVGGADAQDTTVTLGASDPFAPMDTLEKYIGTVKGGKEATVMFPLSVSFGAATQTYSMPVTITYKVGGTTYTTQKTIGIDVQGTVILSIINVDTSTGTPRIDVANLGSRDASSVKATLIIPNTAGNSTALAGGRQGVGQNRSAGGATGGAPGGQGGQGFNGSRQGGNNLGTDLANSQSYVVYKSDIKVGKDSVFAFTGASGSGVATLVLEYSGPNNQRVTQREMITLSGRSGTSTNGRTGTTAARGTDYTTMGLYAAGALIVLFAGYKLYKRRKKK